MRCPLTYVYAWLQLIAAWDKGTDGGENLTEGLPVGRQAFTWNDL